MIFGLSFDLQEREIDAYCLKCGHIIFGAIDGGDVIGYLCPCRQETCEYEERRSPVIAEMDGGEEVVIRKLKPLE